MGKVLDDITKVQGPKMTKMNSKCCNRLDGFCFNPQNCFRKHRLPYEQGMCTLFGVQQFFLGLQPRVPGYTSSIIQCLATFVTTMKVFTPSLENFATLQVGFVCKSASGGLNWEQNGASPHGISRQPFWFADLW